MPINLVARQLRVPLEWLRAEAEAGRVPHLQAGRQILMDTETVERALLQRAREPVEASAGRSPP